MRTGGRGLTVSSASNFLIAVFTLDFTIRFRRFFFADLHALDGGFDIRQRFFTSLVFINRKVDCTMPRSEKASTNFPCTRHNL